MSQRLKQRLVGTVVLVCLAVILVPLLLDGEGVQAPELDVAVPPAPSPSMTPTLEVPDGELPTPVLPPAPDPSGAEPAGQEREQASTAAPGAEVAAEDEPAQGSQTSSPPVDSNLDEQGLLQGWSVRLGTFGHAGNADNLMRELRTDGYKAYTRLIRRSSGDLTAVLVGPVLSRDEARNLRDELAAGYDLDGMVVEFQVTTVE